MIIFLTNLKYFETFLRSNILVDTQNKNTPKKIWRARVMAAALLGNTQK
jgi:hypothetical protein